MTQEQERQNPFASAAVLVISAKKPNFTGKVGEEHLAGFPSIVRANQDMLDRSILKKMGSIRASLTKKLELISLPIGIPGALLVPARKIAQANKLLEEVETAWSEHAEEFTRKYDELRENFQQEFPEYYDAERYPAREIVRQKFSFSWQWLAFAGPDGTFYKKLGAEEMEREKARFLQRIEKMQEDVFLVLANELREKLTKTVETYDKRGTAARNVLENVGKFLKDSYEGLYDEFLYSDKLKELIEGELQPFIQKLDRGKIPKDPVYQAEIVNKSEELAKKIDEIIAEGGATRSLEF